MKLSEKGYLKIGNSIVGWLENGVAKVTFDPDKIEFEQDDFKDFEKELSKFFFKLVEEQKPLPADMARLLNEHFWELG